MIRAFNTTKSTASRNFQSAINYGPLTDKGQVILEFTFCMIIVLLMIFGITKVFTWSGREYAGRSAAHDSTLYQTIDRDYDSMGDGPLKQIDPYFYTAVKMNAIWKGN